MRRFTKGPKASFSRDLHVLGTPPAFVLSQDQTLQFDLGPHRAHERRHEGRHHIERSEASCAFFCLVLAFADDLNGRPDRHQAVLPDRTLSVLTPRRRATTACRESVKGFRTSAYRGESTHLHSIAHFEAFVLTRNPRSEGALSGFL